MKFPTYPRYKTSGVEWLGDVPEHWDTKRLKYLVFRADEKVEADEETVLPYVGLEHFESWTGRLRRPDSELIPTGISNRFRAGDTLFGKLRPYLAKACNVDFEGLCSSELLVLRTAGQDRRFLLYVLLANGFIALVDQSTYGAKMPRASWEFIGSCILPLPPLSERRAIADFLGRETAKIDALVARKRTLIERLKEKRTALISRTVTRGLPPDVARAAGLDPHPKLKASGIDWLGDVPEHWETSKIKYVARIESGHTPSRSADEYWLNCTIPWVSLNDSTYLRNHDFISETAYSISELGMANSSAHLLPPGVVVLSRDATVGLCAITTRPMAVSQHFVAYVCGPRLEPRYLLFTLKAMSRHLDRLSLGATIPTIGMDDVRSLACAIPPLFEQREIADFIDLETAKIDGMVSKVDAAIKRLQEYRTALVTAAVTGKIDVRGTVARNGR